MNSLASNQALASLVSEGTDNASIEVLPKRPLPKVLLSWEGIFRCALCFPGLFQLQGAAGLLQNGLHSAGRELYVATNHQKVGGLSAEILDL